jgi:hypothetical protein
LERKGMDRKGTNKGINFKCIGTNVRLPGQEPVALFNFFYVVVAE